MNKAKEIINLSKEITEAKKEPTLIESIHECIMQELADTDSGEWILVENGIEYEGSVGKNTITMRPYKGKSRKFQIIIKEI